MEGAPIPASFPGVEPGSRDDMSSPSLSVIVPTLNEGETLAVGLHDLQALRGRGAEVILVDGGSTDDTVAQASGRADRVLLAPRGRAAQMNAGAQVALGDILLFLHADTRLPVDADRLIYEGLHANGREWGRFNIRLSSPAWGLRVIAFMMNWRSRLTGIATGDQGIFVQRALFEAVGGYPDIPLMEDIVLSRNLRRHGRPLCLRAMVTTSSRRWERNGVVRTMLLMWRLRLAFFFGADPARLERIYRGR
jgi:rSAM/selenodomain-associated transferase 2